MLNTTVEVVTTVPIVTLLLVSALGPLVMGRCSFWGRCGRSTAGLGQLGHIGTEASLGSRTLWWVASMLASLVMGARVRQRWSWKTSQYALMNSSAVP